MRASPKPPLEKQHAPCARCFVRQARRLKSKGLSRSPILIGGRSAVPELRCTLRASKTPVDLRNLLLPRHQGLPGNQRLHLLAGNPRLHRLRCLLRLGGGFQRWSLRACSGVCGHGEEYWQPRSRQMPFAAAAPSQEYHHEPLSAVHAGGGFRMLSA